LSSRWPVHALADIAALATAAEPRPTGHAAGGADTAAAVIGAGPVFYEKKKKIFKGLPAPKNSYNFVD